MKTSNGVKIGAILRADPCGLGTLSLEFFRHFSLKALVYSPSRVLEFFRHFSIKALVSNPSKVNQSLFPGATWVNRITDEVVRKFLSDLDILLAFETPYHWNTFKIARELKVKTILFTDFEWTPKVLPVKPDLFLCPSLADYEEMDEPKIFLPIPVNRELLPFKERKRAKVFLHNAGGGGKGGRNSTFELLNAIPLVKSEVKFIINLQDLANFSDSRVRSLLSKIPREFLKEGKEFRIGNKGVCVREHLANDYSDLYKEGDVLIHPQIYGGLSLPIQEAISCGMPVIAIDRFPENQFLDRDLLIKPDKGEKRIIYRSVKAHLVSPESIAKKIDEVANIPLERYSRKNDALARKWDWEHLKKPYLRVFEAVKNGKRLVQSEEERRYLISPFAKT